jgi:hypothetical protein
VWLYTGNTVNGDDVSFAVADDYSVVRQFNARVRIVVIAFGAVAGSKAVDVPIAVQNMPLVSDENFLNFSYTQRGPVRVVLHGSIFRSQLSTESRGSLQLAINRSQISLMATRIEKGDTGVLQWTAVPRYE